jgi:hypothetical protein
MRKNHFTIRQMTRQEIYIAVDWAAMEGWNPVFARCGFILCRRSSYPWRGSLV